jgi:hypothetical protein
VHVVLSRSHSEGQQGQGETNCHRHFHRFRRRAEQDGMLVSPPSSELYRIAQSFILF